jgi:hypothetical protein
VFHSIRSFIIANVLVALLAVPAIHAKEKSLSGDWTFSVEHLPLKLVLVQKGKTVTGTLDYPHGDPIRLTGTFRKDTLRLSGDGTGPNFTVHLDATGSLNADGTFAGDLKALLVDLNDEHQVVRKHDQAMQWTAERGLHGVRSFHP